MTWTKSLHILVFSSLLSLPLSLDWCLLSNMSHRMSCPTPSVPKNCQHSVFLYLVDTLQMDFGKWMSCELQIFHNFLISDIVNSYNFADCVFKNGNRKSRSVTHNFKNSGASMCVYMYKYLFLKWCDQFILQALIFSFVNVGLIGVWVLEEKCLKGPRNLRKCGPLEF